MKPVKQNRADDCVRACMASILELPIELVPEFSCEDWFREACLWLEPMGYTLINSYHNPDFETKAWALGAVDSSREGWNHCVVVFGHEIKWDPQKYADNGVGRELREVCYFVPIDAAQALRFALQQRLSLQQNTVPPPVDMSRFGTEPAKKPKSPERVGKEACNG